MDSKKSYKILINKYFKDNKKAFNFVAEYYGKKINKKITISLSNKERTSYCYSSVNNGIVVIIAVNNIILIVEDMGDYADLIEQFLYTFIMHEIGHALWDFYPLRSPYFVHVYESSMLQSLLNSACDNRLERIIEEDNTKVEFKLARYVIFDKRLSEVFSIWKTEVLKGQNFDFTNALFRMINNKPVVDFMKSIDERIELPLLRLIDCEKRFRANNCVLFNDSTNHDLILLFEEMVGYANEINQIIREKKAKEEKQKQEKSNEQESESDEDGGNCQDSENEEENENEEDGDEEDGDEEDSDEEDSDEEDEEGDDADGEDEDEGFGIDLDLENKLYGMKKAVIDREDNTSFEVAKLFIEAKDITAYKQYKIGAVTSNRIRGIKGATIREEQLKRRVGNQKELSLKSYARREHAVGEKMFERKNEVLKRGNNTAKVTFIIDVSGSMRDDFFDGSEKRERYQFVIDYVKSFYDQTSKFLDIQIYSFADFEPRELSFGGENFIAGGVCELNRNALREDIFRQIVKGGTQLPLIRPIEKDEETIIITDGGFEQIDSEYLKKATFVFIDVAKDSNGDIQDIFKPVKNKIFVNNGENIVKSFEKATEKIKDILSKKAR